MLSAGGRVKGAGERLASARTAISWNRYAPWIIGLACLVVYSNTFHVPFLFDGRFFIEADPGIHELKFPWKFMGGTTRPLTRLTFALNYAAGQLNLAGYHAVNLAIHTLAALALYGLIRRTFQSPKFQGNSVQNSDGLALSAALIWAIHPLQTESVTYIFQRAESLMGLFYLLTLYCMARGFQSVPTGARWKVAAWVSCFLGMGAKAIMVTAPVMAVVYDRYFWAHSWKEIWTLRKRFYMLMAANWVILLTIAVGPHESAQTVGVGSLGVSPWFYAVHQARSISQYLSLTFWPFNLVFYYGHPLAGGFFRTRLSIVVVASLIAATFCAVKFKSKLGFLGIWFFVILVPTSSFFPIADFTAEHRMYLPLAAMAVLTVYFIYWATRMLIAESGRRARVQIAIVAAVAVALCARTFHRNSLYGSRLRLWSDTTSKRPASPRAHLQLGLAMYEVGRINDAIDEFKKALGLPKVPWSEKYINVMLCLNLANIYENIGDEAQAQIYYQKALKSDPRHYDIRCDVARLMAAGGHINQAIDLLHEGLKIDPDNDMLHQHLGFYLEKTGAIEEAIDHYSQAVARSPNVWAIHYSLGRALIKAGRVPEGISHLSRAESLALQEGGGIPSPAGRG